MRERQWTFVNQRHAVVALVLLLHMGGLWALQSGLLRRMVETIVPVQVLAEFIELQQPRVEPAPPPPQPAPEPPRPRPVTPRAPAPAPQPAPLPVAEAAPLAPMEVAAPEPAPPSDPAPPTRSAPPSEAPPAPPVIVLPSSNAAYLNNPPPSYPPLSNRLGEQGLVRVRVLVDGDGTATRAEIQTSSGFERLDQAALQATLRWRYVPGTRNGQRVAMWVEVPLRFRLNAK